MPVSAPRINPQKFVEQCVANAHNRPSIQIGSRSDDVRVWQVLMQRELGASLKADGIFGQITQAVTMAFQRKIGLVPDGIVGPKSWAAAMVAPCYAAALQQQQAASVKEREALARIQQGLQQQAKKQAAHGVGALDLSFSVVDTKSMVLGVVIGVAAGAVLFRRK